MATAMSTMTPVERTMERERELIDRALEHWKRAAKGPLKEYYRENDGGMRDRVAVEILLLDEKLERRDYSGLYSRIKEDGGYTVLEPVRMEYAIRLFNTTLEKEPVLALQAYDLVRVLDNETAGLAQDILERGNSLFNRFASAAAACIVWHSAVNPRATLNGLGLTSLENLKKIVPFLRDNQ